MAKVLVVDDGPAVQVMIRLLLERAGRLGATRSLPTPFKPAALFSMVTHCLGDEMQTSPSPDRNVASGR